MRKVYCLTQTTLFPSSQKENGYQKCKKTSHLLAQKSMATIMKNKPCDCRLYSYVLSQCGHVQKDHDHTNEATIWHLSGL